VERMCELGLKLRNALLAFTVAFALAPTVAQGKAIHWHAAGASIYGGVCGPQETQGYRGAYLPDNPMSFAELGMGTALGDLPYGTQVRVLDPVTHKRAWVRKLDIGAGGGDVFGVPRDIDLYAPAAERIAGASCTWTGRVLWRLRG
jgi:hypothetical protein